MVRPGEQSRPDPLRDRLTGSWLLRKWTPSQPSPTAQGEGQPLIAHDRSPLDSDALKSRALPHAGRVREATPSPKRGREVFLSRFDVGDADCAGAGVGGEHGADLG